MCQMLVEGALPQANLDRARRAILAAEADVAVLPECLDIGWTHPAARDLAQPIPGPHSDVLAQAARRRGIHVVAGLVERAGARIYNAAVLIAPSGEILLKHRKINELDIALDLYSTGTRLEVAATPLGTIGIDICADNFPDTLCLGESLARMGATVLLSPCAWAVDAGHDNFREPYGGLWIGAYTALAKKHRVAVVGVSNVGWLTAGPWAGRKCIGCSLAVGPDGEILAQAPYGESAETTVVVEIG
jgi:predicted amidohydrolase